MQCAHFLSLHFVVHGHAVSADGLADVAHGDMAGIDLVGVQIVHALKLGHEHGVVVALADVSCDLALFQLRDHAVERGKLREKIVGFLPGAFTELSTAVLTVHFFSVLFFLLF